MKKILLMGLALGMFMRDAGTGTENAGGGAADGTNNTGTANDTNAGTGNASTTTATAPTLGDTFKNHLTSLDGDGDEKRENIVAESDKLVNELKNVRSNLPSSSASPITQQVLTLQVQAAEKALLDATSEVLDSLEA